MSVLTAVRKILGFEMTIAEWIGTAIILAVPYLVVGAVWTAFHLDYVNAINTNGVNRLMALLGSVAAWPVLLFSTVCMT
ncbi:hypothetical protein [Mycolicibacterium holsaticum]|jgi:hypothetical protein|uniref:hypothetical protein n=1 Tax=Mycolicibacterium holsaticum TaxID=152142 RepID=UPI0009FE73CA|nr:hypothetical protein [Mycolicibacterium holsaticum]MDA4107126.1 membrane protein [Mycolicibacterium holsaticum DSM 44478 = JCM 12374]QZA11332.1 hypothetical protein K3U96_19190 [Mycolicibacterium holsaticum DSM 44478 = JCM 12374]UNC11176.1 hypothetical protein H5U41_07635 [Mycolicibacterium holsaticum DSM 44478 = JCM 12374]